MLEKYYLLNSNILFKIDKVNNRFYMFDINKNEWILNYALMDKYYDAASDIIEISENDAFNFIESLKGSAKKL